MTWMEEGKIFHGIRGVQVAVLLGSYFGTHLVLKVSNFPEEIVSKGDEHRLARQKVISAWLA